VQPDFTGKRVTVSHGAERHRRGAGVHGSARPVTITDKKPLDQLAAQVRSLGQRTSRSRGRPPDRIFIEADLIVLAPGVRRSRRYWPRPARRQGHQRAGARMDPV